MSTAGKVLTVVVALATIGWIVLMSMVANLNTNFGKKLEAMTAQIEQLDKDIATAQRTADETFVAVRLEQEKMSRRVEHLHAVISGLEVTEANLSQALAEVTLRIEQVEQTAKDAEAAHQVRVAEQKAAGEQLVALRDEVRERHEVVEGLVTDLKSLQTEFVATTESNRSLQEQLKAQTGSPTAGGGSRIRPASFVR